MNDEHLRERLKEKERQVGALMKRVEEQREEIIAIEKNYDSLWDSATALKEEREYLLEKLSKAPEVVAFRITDKYLNDILDRVSEIGGDVPEEAVVSLKEGDYVIFDSAAEIIYYVRPD